MIELKFVIATIVTLLLSESIESIESYLINI